MSEENHDGGTSLQRNEPPYDECLPTPLEIDLSNNNSIKVNNLSVIENGGIVDNSITEQNILDFDKKISLLTEKINSNTSKIDNIDLLDDNTESTSIHNNIIANTHRIDIVDTHISSFDTITNDLLQRLLNLQSEMRASDQLIRTDQQSFENKTRADISSIDSKLSGQINLNKFNITRNTSTVENLRTKVQDNFINLRTNEGKINSNRSDIDNIKLSVDSNNIRINRTLANISDNRQSIQGNATAISEIDSKIEEVKNNVAAVNNKVSSVEQRIVINKTATQASINRINLQTLENKNNVEEVERKIFTQRFSIDKNTTSINDHQRVITSNGRDISTINNSLVDYDRRIKINADGISNAKTNVNINASKIQANGLVIDSNKRRIDSVVDNIDTINIDVDRVEESVNEVKTVVDTLEESVITNRDGIAANRRIAASNSALLSDHTSSITRHEVEIDSLRNVAASNTRSINSNASSILNTISDLDAAESTIVSNTSKINQNTSDISEIKNQMAVFEANQTEIRQLILQKLNELSNIREVVVVNEQSSEVTSTLDPVNNAEIAVLRETIIALDTRIDLFESKLTDDAVLSVDELESDIALINNNMDSVRSDVSDLKEQFNDSVDLKLNKFEAKFLTQLDSLINEISNIPNVKDILKNPGDILTLNQSKILTNISRGADTQILMSDADNVNTVRWANPPEAFGEVFSLFPIHNKYFSKDFDNYNRAASEITDPINTSIKLREVTDIDGVLWTTYFPPNYTHAAITIIYKPEFELSLMDLEFDVKFNLVHRKLENNVADAWTSINIPDHRTVMSRNYAYYNHEIELKDNSLYQLKLRSGNTKNIYVQSVMITLYQQMAKGHLDPKALMRERFNSLLQRVMQLEGIVDQTLIR